MKNVLLFILGISVFSCKIKDENAKIHDEVNAVDTSVPTAVNDQAITSNTNEPWLMGSWVGLFENAKEDDYSKDLDIDEGLYWRRENKINISLDNIKGDSIFGHSVVAGNNRTFKGILKKENGFYNFQVKEPGDDKYDGSFNFKIKEKDTILVGSWKAFKKIDIQERKYTLSKKEFNYNKNQMLEEARSYADWGKMKRINVDEDYFRDGFATATEAIYSINASANLLKKEDVENLKKGDLLVIRNTIYARHGYSFKKRPLRIFFDAQPWYMPLHTDIKKELTDVEKENIKLLMKYEKNAKEYYDYFGRG